MISFVSYPKNYTPLDEGVIFVVESDIVTDFMVDIVDYKSATVIGSKLIRQTTTAVVDIAPYITGITPSEAINSEKCSVESLPAGAYYISVTTTEEAENSEIVVVTNNRKQSAYMALQSLFPKNRTIGYGEQDDLRFTSDMGTYIELRITTDKEKKLSIEHYAPFGVVQIHIATTQLASDTAWFTAEIFVDNMLVESIRYTIVPRYKGSVRVAWLSPEGSVERYTFLQTVSRSCVAERKRLFTNPTTGEVVSCSSAHRVTLRSQPLLEEVAETLATILSAPRVWIESEQMALAQVLDTEIVTSRLGKSSVVELTLEYGREEVVQ